MPLFSFENGRVISLAEKNLRQRRTPGVLPLICKGLKNSPLNFLRKTSAWMLPSNLPLLWSPQTGKSLLDSIIVSARASAEKR